MRIAIGLLTTVALYGQADVPAREAALGAELARQVRRNTPILEDDAVLNYVQTLAARLSRQLPEQPPFPYTFAMTAEFGQPAPAEPIWLPGGYIFVPANLILAAGSESEFARALAHAMIHIAEHHARSSAQAGQLATIPLVFLGGAGPDAPVPTGFRQVQSTVESETDLGAEKLVAAEFEQRNDAASEDFARIQAELLKLAPKRRAPSLFK